MSNPMATLQQFQKFVNNFQKMNKNPQQAVQELLNTGQMTQTQYNELAARASQILGRK